MGSEPHDCRRTRSTIVFREERIQPVPCVVLFPFGRLAAKRAWGNIRTSAKYSPD